MSGWIGVDLDGTLAHYGDWVGTDEIGDPIPLMLVRVKRWLEEGKSVKIFTSRLQSHGCLDIATGKQIDVVSQIQEWCQKHIGRVLEITNVKDFEMIELWDDRCVHVEANTGRILG